MRKYFNPELLELEEQIQYEQNYEKFCRNCFIYSFILGFVIRYFW